MNIFIAGEPGSGKTSWCTGYVDWLRQRNYRVGGTISPEVRQGGQRIGFDIVDLITGEQTTFARLSDGDHPKGIRIGSYAISEDGISFGLRAIERAVNEACDWVVVDEVGPMELQGRGLMPAVSLACRRSSNVLIIVRSSLLEALFEYLEKSRHSCPALQLVKH